MGSQRHDKAGADLGYRSRGRPQSPDWSRSGPEFTDENVEDASGATVVAILSRPGPPHRWPIQFYARFKSEV